MRWSYTHGGLLAALPEVGLLGMGCWRIVRVPQNPCLTPLPGVGSMLLFFGIAVWMLLQAMPLTHSMESSPKPGQGLSVSAFKGCSSDLNASRSEVTGSHVLSNYVARILSRGPGILSSFGHPSWVVSLVLQNLIGAPWGPYGHTECVFSGSESALPPGLCLGWASWCVPCCVIPWFSFQGLGCGVLFFRPGLCGEESGPLLPCSSVCGLHCTSPTKRDRNGRLLYSVRAVRCYLPAGLRIVSDASGSFFAAGCSTKELSKTTVSFLLWMPLSRVSSSWFRNGLFCVP